MDDTFWDMTFRGIVRTFGLVIRTTVTHALLPDLDHNDTSE